MNYRELLTELINGSGKTLNAIVKELKADGVEITSNYLSILKNTDNKIASEEVSRAIAKACNAEYEEILVVQGYLDKAPETIRKMLEIVANLPYITAGQLLSKMNPEQQIAFKEKLEEQMNSHSMAYRLCENVSTIANFSFDKMLLEMEKVTKVSMVEKLKKVQSGEWLLVPVNTEEEVVKITNTEARKIMDVLAMDNS